MNNSAKSNNQLIEELNNLKHTIKELEKKLSESTLLIEQQKHTEYKYHNILMNLMEGFYAASLDGKLLDHNIEFLNILELNTIHKTDEINLLNYWENPEDRKRYITELLKKGFIKNYIINLKTSQGNKIVVQANSQLITNKAGKPVKIEGTILDITEQVKANHLLEENERKYRELYENSPLGYQSLDASGNLIEANTALCWMLGYDKGEIIGKWFGDFLDPESIKTFKTNFPGFKNQSVPINLISKTGNLISVEINGKIRYGEKGKLKQIHCVIQDITERKLTKQALQHSLQMSNDLVKSIPSGIFIYQYKKPDKFYLIEANKEAELLTGIKLSAWKNKEFNEIWPKAKKLGIIESYLKVIKTGKNYDNEDTYYEDERLKGAYKIRAFVLPNNRLAVAFEDITKRKQIEKALLESEKRFYNLMQQSPSVIEIYDLDGLQISVNNAYEELWGFSAGRTLNKFNVLKSNEVKDSGLYEYIRRAYNGEAVSPPEYMFDPTGETEARGAGRIRWLSTKIYPLKDKNGTVTNIVITHTDITDKKNAEIKIINSEGRLKTLIANYPKGSISLIDKDLNIAISGGTEYKKFNIDPGNLKGMHILKALPPEVAEINKPYILNALNGETSSFLVNYKNFVYENKVAPVKDQNNEVNFVLLMSNDVTDQKTAETALMQQHEKLEEMVSERTRELELKNKELQLKNDELENYHTLFIEREFRIKELRDLLKQYQNKPHK